VVSGAGLGGCGKFSPTWIRSSEPRARSESLYRLHYPDLFLAVISLLVYLFPLVYLHCIRDFRIVLCTLHYTGGPLGIFDDC
jgi:hypothetical protein